MNRKQSSPSTLRGELEQHSAVKTVSTEQAESEHSWPPEPLIVRNEVTGVLADRIRNKLGVKRRKVFIVEETYYGGYSEYTQENSTTFEVECGDKRRTFYIDDSEEGWSSLPANSSVFARFQLWLRSAEDPEQVWAESVVTTTKQVATLTLDALEVKPGSLLYGSLVNRSRGPEMRAYIVRLSNGRYGIEIQRTYRGGQTGVTFESLNIPVSGDPEEIVAEADRSKIVQQIADRYTQGTVLI